MPQLVVVCNLGISFNMDSFWTSWTLNIEIVSAILVKSNYSWTCYWCHWKFYLIILFLSICRMSKSDFVCVLDINLKPRWSWTPSLTHSQTLEFQIGLDIHLDVCISLPLQHPLDVCLSSSSSPWFLTIIKSLDSNWFPK
jgi:hypothetical protein